MTDPASGDRVALRLGAGLFVLGNVVEAGGRLQIEAAAYRVDPDCERPFLRAAEPGRCRTPEPAARAVVSGPADSVFGLVDGLAARLLGELGDSNADRLLRTASLTTASLPAFKAYLNGEELMRDGRFERAAEAYLEAIALDSTFALAYYRLALAQEWAPLPGSEASAAAAARHGARLSARDRALLEALRVWRTGDAAQADRAFRAVLTRYPDDVDAWFQLGEVQFHHGPLLGRPLGESDEAWRRVLSYEPKHLFALTHLARSLIVGGRIAALDSLLAPFVADSLPDDRRLEEILILRAVATGDTATARALARDAGRGESLAAWRIGVYLTAFSHDPTTMRPIIVGLTNDQRDPALRADLHWLASVIDLASGRLAAAERARAAAVATERAVPADRRRTGFDPITEWYAATLPLPYADSTLSRVRRSAQAFRAGSAERRAPFENAIGLGTPILLEPLRQYTIGTLSLRLGDTAAAVSAAAALRQAASDEANPLVRDLDRGLRARLAWGAGRAEAALGLLEEMELVDLQGDVLVTPFVTRVNERHLRAEILAALGRDEQALRWLASLGDGAVTEIPMRALSHLREAEIRERRGEARLAARHYARFVELWRDADPALRPVVDTARARLARLRGGK